MKNNKLDRMDNSNNAATRVDIFKSNKLVYKLVCAFIVLLIIMTIVKVGAIPQKLILGIGLLIITYIATTIAKVVIKNDYNKAIGLLIVPGFAGNIYSVLMGGSSTTFIVNFVIMALALLYFDSKLFLKIVLPVTIFATLLGIIYPPSVEGPGGKMSDAIIKCVLLNVTAIIFMQVIEIGDKLNKEAFSALMKLEKKIELSNGIVEEFGTTLVDTRGYTNDLINKSSSVDLETKDILNEMLKIDDGIIKMNNTIEKIGTLIDENMDISENVKDSYKEVVTAVAMGRKNIESTLETMRNMNALVEETYEKTDYIGEVMEEIEGVLDNIVNVTSQTKLLALNASIESARVGDRGKGFDVVAEEIRALSDESNKASTNIKQIVEILNKTAAEATMNIKDGSKVAKKTYKELYNIIDILKEIDDSSIEVDRALKEENEAVKEIRGKFNNVSEKMKYLTDKASKNMPYIREIEDNINEQKELMVMYGSKLDNIEVLSEKMKF